MRSERLDMVLSSFREELFSIMMEEVLKGGGKKSVRVELPSSIDEDRYHVLTLDVVYIEDNSLYAHGYSNRYGEVEEDMSAFTCDELLTIIECM